MDQNTNEEKIELFMNDTSLSDTEQKVEDTFAALSKAVAEGNTAEINRLMALDGEIKESEEDGKAEEPEEKAEETPEDDAAAKEGEEKAEPEKDESKQSKIKTTAETDPEAAKSAASTPTKDDEIAELKRELHALRSDAGRMRHVQSRMHQLENELRAYRARSPNPNEKSSTPAKPELPAKLSEKLKSLKEIDPDLAETFEAVVGMVQETRQTAEQVAAAKVQEASDEEFYAEQWGELTKTIPQAPQIFASTEWQQWKGTLTPGERAMAESGYAKDVIRAIHAFAADMKQLHGQDASKPEATSKGGDPVQNTTSVPAQQPAQPNPEVAEARNRKLTTTAAVKAPAAKVVQELDEQSLFLEMYNELAKKNHILK